MFVKICGMTRQEDLACAAALGAGLCGFIFHPKSPRYIEPALAGKLESFGMKRVGVFLEQDPDVILQAAEAAHLDFVQLHGGQSSECAGRIGRERVFRVLWPDMYTDAAGFQEALDEASRTSCCILLDAGKTGSGGTGAAFDWMRLSGVNLQHPWMLAGGLVPASVRTVQSAPAGSLPDGLDFNSGLEDAPGKKNHQLVREALDAVRGLAGGVQRWHF